MKPAGLFRARKSLARRWGKHGLRDERGAELLEFAFCANIFFLFCFGFLELCMVLFSMNTVDHASRQAARWASVRGTTSSSSGVCANPNISTCPALQADIQTYVQTIPGMSTAVASVNWCGSDGVTGCTTSQSNAAPGHIVKVTVTYTFASVPFVSKAAIKLSSTAEKVIWQ